MTNGHNSVDKTALATFVERVEQLEGEKAILSGEIKEVYAEAKGDGFDVKVLRKLIGIRRQDKIKREAEQEMLDIYMNALGMLSDLPLGQAAIKEAGLSA